MSMKVLSDHGYTTISHPYEQGVTVHAKGDVTFTFRDIVLLQGWRDINGFWQVPLSGENCKKPTNSKFVS